jgi:hypothetical protein
VCVCVCVCVVVVVCVLVFIHSWHSRLTDAEIHIYREAEKRISVPRLLRYMFAEIRANVSILLEISY